jgi:two-component system, OmpR family, alkaline phosphatase synthesis response regulator PhoP
MSKILIVDDEPDILDFLSYCLRKEGFEVATAYNGRNGLEVARQVKPNLIILDMMMPEMDGVEMCRQLRKISDFNNTIVAFLTAREEDVVQISALEVGGDDYITKPIKPNVLISRVKALLRRQRANVDENDVMEIADFRIDRTKVEVWKGETLIELPKKEFELFCLLASRPGKVFAREEIYTKIWGSDVIVGDRTIDVHIRKLREKLGADNIKTLKGIGYKFDF